MQEDCPLSKIAVSVTCTRWKRLEAVCFSELLQGRIMASDSGALLLTFWAYKGAVLHDDGAGDEAWAGHLIAPCSMGRSKAVPI